MLYLWPQHSHGDEFEERDEIFEKKGDIKLILIASRVNISGFALKKSVHNL